MASSTTIFKVKQPDGTRKTIEVDEFSAQTVDGYTLEVRAVLGENFAVVLLEGDVRHRYSTTLDKDDAFNLYHSASVMTQHEIWTAHNFK